MSFPKVLIFGQPFNNFSGGGITLTNLFKGWPKDKVAVTFIGHGLINVTYDVCDTYYQLGREEHKWIFPFNLINRGFPSGLKSKENKIKLPVNSIQIGFRYYLVNQFFYPLLRWFGVFHCVSRIRLSVRMKNWLSEYQPEILYLQISSRETLLFASQLTDYLQIPTAIHIMDDWLSTVSTKGLLKNFWHAKINKEFSKLLGKIKLHFSICEAMSVEYMKRYNQKFIPFHNPLELEKWISFSKKNYDISKKDVIILHSGRLGIGITNSLIDVASAIDNCWEERFSIKLHIQTPSKDKSILDRLKKYKCIVINQFAEYWELPEIFSNADILLLANEFDKDGIRYLRFSMPTKASEYMISGTPVLVYAPESSAVSRLFNENKCGICVNNRNPEQIVSAINLLLTDAALREEIGTNAMRFAKSKFSAKDVRNEFQDLLKNLAQK